MEKQRRFFQVGFSEGSFIGRFIDMMDDDLNTSGAIGLVFDKVRDMNRVMDSFHGQG